MIKDIISLNDFIKNNPSKKYTLDLEYVLLKFNSNQVTFTENSLTYKGYDIGSNDYIQEDIISEVIISNGSKKYNITKNMWMRYECVNGDLTVTFYEYDFFKSKYSESKNDLNHKIKEMLGILVRTDGARLKISSGDKNFLDIFNEYNDENHELDSFLGYELSMLDNEVAFELRERYTDGEESNGVLFDTNSNNLSISLTDSSDSELLSYNLNKKCHISVEEPEGSPMDAYKTVIINF